MSQHNEDFFMVIWGNFASLILALWWEGITYNLQEFNIKKTKGSYISVFSSLNESCIHLSGFTF